MKYLYLPCLFFLAVFYTNYSKEYIANNSQAKLRMPASKIEVKELTFKEKIQKYLKF